MERIIPFRRKPESRKKMSSFYVYILVSKRNGTLHTGMTGDLIRRVYEHRNDLTEGFTEKYGVHELVYFEHREAHESVVQREKCIKEWKRKWKIALIEKTNPDWKDLYDDLTK